MALKFLFFVALLGVAHCAVYPIASTYPDYHVPQYSYDYGVSDPWTGDHKTHAETRVGDLVKGQYSLVDPDGTKRVVDYAADSVNGFNANVHKEPLYNAGLPVASYPGVSYPTPVTYSGYTNGYPYGYPYARTQWGGYPPYSAYTTPYSTYATPYSYW